MNEPNIKIEVVPEYISEHSRPMDSAFTFAYHVSIYNCSNENVQLMTRKWVITDANGNKTEVAGDGVIGEQPVIKPGQTHHYSSGAVLKTPLGCMQGHYGMQTEDGDSFNAPIPVFTLAVPGLVN